MAGGRTGTFDYRKRRRHLISFCALLGIACAVSVAMFKFLGLANIAVPASVVVGVAIALVCDALSDGRGARDAR